MLIYRQVVALKTKKEKEKKKKTDNDGKGVALVNLGTGWKKSLQSNVLESLSGWWKTTNQRAVSQHKQSNCSWNMAHNDPWNFILLAW